MKKYLLQLWAKWQLRRMVKLLNKPAKKVEPKPTFDLQFTELGYNPNSRRNYMPKDETDEGPESAKSDFISDVVTGYVAAAVIDNLFSSDNTSSHDSYSSDSGSSDFGGFDGGDGGGGGASGDW